MKFIVTTFCLFSFMTFGQSDDSSIIHEPPRSTAAQIIEQMRGFSMQTSAGWRSDGSVDPIEQRRQEIIDKLHTFKEKSIPSLINALNDSDVQMRRNVELVLVSLAGAYDGKEKIDIREALPALIKTMKDSDPDVRGWAAHALAEIGPDAKPAIPSLLALLEDSQEGPRNASCMALGSIGPAAQDALPALRKALSDPSKNVRQFAQRAIVKISNER